MRDGVTPLAWSPLAGGRLATGEGLLPSSSPRSTTSPVREGVDRSHVALAFVLAHPAAPVAIIGSQSPDRITAATAALGVHLDRSDVYGSSRRAKEYRCHERRTRAHHSPRDRLVRRALR
jgi:predicted oxidoreductase